MPATAAARLPVLMSQQQKARIAKKAKAANLSMGEFLRRAAEAYDPSVDDTLLTALIEQVGKTTTAAMSAMDIAMNDVAASQQRILLMEAEAKRDGRR